MNKDKIQQAKDVAKIMYEGKLTPHRSCGVTLAETFCLPSHSYQALRRGGITGEGECGAIAAGRLVLGEILGNDDPTAPVTKELFEGMHLYKTLTEERINSSESGSHICKDMILGFEDFNSEERRSFCAGNVIIVAECIAEIFEKLGVDYKVKDASSLIEKTG